MGSPCYIKVRKALVVSGMSPISKVEELGNDLSWIAAMRKLVIIFLTTSLSREIIMIEFELHIIAELYRQRLLEDLYRSE